MNEEAHGYIRFKRWLLRKLLKKRFSPVGLLGTSESGSEGGFNTWECGHDMANTDSNSFLLNTDVNFYQRHQILQGAF